MEYQYSHHRRAFSTAITFLACSRIHIFRLPIPGRNFNVAAEGLICSWSTILYVITEHNISPPLNTKFSCLYASTCLLEAPPYVFLGALYILYCRFSIMMMSFSKHQGFLWKTSVYGRKEHIQKLFRKCLHS